MEIETLSRSLVEARHRAKLTQTEVARKMGTTQEAVARAERGTLPSWQWLDRYAQACGQPIALWVSFGSKRLTPFEFPGHQEAPEAVSRRRQFRRQQLDRQRRSFLRASLPVQTEVET